MTSPILSNNTNTNHNSNNLILESFAIPSTEGEMYFWGEWLLEKTDEGDI